MNIGIPKEIKAQESRVSMIPSSAGDLVKRGHRVFVQAGAGAGASYPDETYLAAGAEILPDADAVFGAAEMIVKVKEPQPEEIEPRRRGGRREIAEGRVIVGDARPYL